MFYLVNIRTGEILEKREACNPIEVYTEWYDYVNKEVTILEESNG